MSRVTFCETLLNPIKFVSGDLVAFVLVSSESAIDYRYLTLRRVPTHAIVDARTNAATAGSGTVTDVAKGEVFA